MSQLATAQGSKYSDEDRRKALADYSVYGSIQKTAESTGIADRTLYDWSHEEWWQSELAKLREETKELVRAKVSKLVETGYDAIQDRVDNGDAYVDKNGEIQRKPASLRDLSVATGIAFDKLRLIDNQPTSISSNNSDALLALKAQFEELAGQPKVIEGQVIDNKED